MVWSGGRDGEPGFKDKEQEREKKRERRQREIGGVDRAEGRAEDGPSRPSTRFKGGACNILLRARFCYLRLCMHISRRIWTHTTALTAPQVSGGRLLAVLKNKLEVIPPSLEVIGDHLSNLLPNLRGRGGKELEEGKLGPGSTSTTS
jgi:hypothetical protein